ncbi:MAG: mechanosensitive ion channel family protein, partial [Deltaproteobacteria bacterium]|nr:mechanosensitive ion channel family protein [Deltaproteobacteria bacterium]
RILVVAVFMLPAYLCEVPSAYAQAAALKKASETLEEKNGQVTPEPSKTPPTGPIDEYNRGTPRSAVEGFVIAADKGDFDLAVKYLDLRKLPEWMSSYTASELARQLKIVLDRKLPLDLELISEAPEGYTNDGLPRSRDSLGRLKTPAKVYEILIQRVPREDGVPIWKFSRKTVAEIPYLYRKFGYRPFEESLSKYFPGFMFLGWEAWQWALGLIFIGLAYVAAFLPTWLLGLFLGRKNTGLRKHIIRFFRGPLRILLWLVLLRIGVEWIGPSLTLREGMKGGTLLILAFTWAFLRSIDLIFAWWTEHLRKSDVYMDAELLGPVRKTVKILIVIFALLLWLDNFGFDVTTLLTGLGVGGIAVALAAQDSIKNFIGSIMILIDKPYRVGERIVAKGHDGVVEDIGLRSTKMRLLTGHQTIIPNEEMARADIENIARRPHIRRRTNIRIPYDTPAEKVEKALGIIKEALADHEGMNPAFPPRVYLSEFNPDSLNIVMFYWFHPNDYWAFLDFSQRVNLEIMRAFEKEWIKFAIPATKTYLTREDAQSLNPGVSGDSPVRAQTD